MPLLLSCSQLPLPVLKTYFAVPVLPDVLSVSCHTAGAFYFLAQMPVHHHDTAALKLLSRLPLPKLLILCRVLLCASCFLCHNTGAAMPVHSAGLTMMPVL